MTALTQKLFQLEPQYRERVWGGQRLKAHNPPIGELWGAFDDSRVLTGPHAGQSVGQIANEFGPAFLGRDVMSRFGPRFPLLIKLLDCAGWLSVQVHPNDQQAEQLVGRGQFGKTEAWHFLAVDENTSILAGVKPGTTATALASAIRTGRVLEVAQRLEVAPGETYLIPAGTLHALGPGLLLYEVQQASDTTYRVYDWDRPASDGRPLHVEESVAVTNPDSTPVRTPRPALHGTSAARTAQCPFFALDALQIADSPFLGDEEGRTLGVLTVTAGAVSVTCGDETVQLGRHDTALVAGSAGAYQLRAVDEPASVLRATVPPPTGL
ncbi:MAG: type I phosphomannose isomerase catalytic subunit [Acidobacteriota bacterium]